MKFDRSVATVLEEANNRPAGFDYMRLLLSLSVIAMHTVVICYGAAADLAMWESPLRPVLRAILPMFFALSGFLVAASFLRCRTMVMFFGLRAIRIYPALIVEVMLSAFILGPLLTAYPMADYFTDHRLAVYLLNALGEPHYELPGLFLDNPNPGQVNRQLWTVPFELGCYLAMAVLALAGAIRRHWLAPLAAIGLTVTYYIAREFKYDGAVPQTVGPLAGALLIVCFLAGVTIYLYRTRIPLNHGLGIASGLVGCALATFGDLNQFLAPWPLAYFTVYLGTLDPRRLGWLKHADISYGLFLYGYPVQQMFASLGGIARNGVANFLLSVIGTGLFATASWLYIEKPALNLRQPLRAFEDRYLERRRGRKSLRDEETA